MKPAPIRPLFFCLASLTLATILPNTALAQKKISTKPGAQGNLSLRLEIEHAIDKGVTWLKQHQNPKTGAWSEAKQPALSALAVAAIAGDPALKQTPKDQLPPQIEKGLSYIVSKQKSDGGIYGKGLATYNTSLSMMALMQGSDNSYDDVIRSARKFLINQQSDFDARGKTDNLFDGGIGYGGTYAHSDLSNTHLALEALHYSKQYLSDTSAGAGEFDLDWSAAIEFVEKCQNSEKTMQTLGKENYAVDEKDRGGFVYFPGDTKAGEKETADGKIALRSYGSMGYAGMLSFIYADMDKQDPRMQAALTWLQENFSIDQNPGLKAQGLYYYYHTMAKALNLYGIDTLTLKDGSKIQWREKLALKLFDEQQRDGSWVNQGSSRWWEDDPVLVTAYAVLALEHIHRGL
ncbi:MAG: terpene cyclase/mutase family protein [Verrucomicrobiales bacterium]|nr:terpene cyclase/mutase family protein [Verrucomicrobiales bacterium]